MDEGRRTVKLPVLQRSDDDSLSRRRFLALFGASAAIATGAGCKPVKGRLVVPYTKKQEEIVPGVADFYASTFQEGEVAYPVLVKTREGRPILVEGNDEHPLYRGKTSLRAMADVLGLYDPDRLRGPMLEGSSGTWKDAFGQFVSGLKAATASRKATVLVTPAVLSPSRKALLARLGSAVPDLRQLAWEPAADHAGKRAEQEAFAEIRLPRYRFEKANVIVALEADFLGGMGDSVVASAGFSARREAREMNRLYVLEGGMSLTGSKADVRIPIRPSALARIAFGLLRAVHLKSGRPLPEGLSPAALEPFALERLPEAKPFASALQALVADLSAASDRALVLAGPAASPEAHTACLALNAMLGAENSTVASNESVVASPLASPDDLERLVKDMAAGQIGAAIFWDTNPAYDYPDQEAFRSALAKVPLRVKMGLISDETASLCSLVLPTHHWLESWNDLETSPDSLTLQQPVVAPLYDTLQGEDMILRVLQGLGQPQTPSYLEFVKQRWQSDVQPKSSPVAFAEFWQSCLHDGLLRREPKPLPPRRLDGQACARAAARAQTAQTSTFELVLDPDPRLFDGRYATNGWLQEMPDPVTKVSWGNPLSMSPGDADRLGLKNGDMVSLGHGPALPILRQRGQAEGVLRLTLGHGRSETTVAALVGTRASAYAPHPGLQVVPVDGLTKTGATSQVIVAQDHDTKDGRDIARQWTLAELAAKPQHEGEAEKLATLYEAHEHKGPRWGMAIDLSACVGCGACVIACQSENNVPVVGPEQMAKGRGMHWMRIDRYYEGEGDGTKVVHQPMLCQHCDNAPCETVCPVNATTHGDDGINQMAYNRCVGTRYCANNCPYKVRRFNFLDFTRATPPSLQLAFNPEVTVRPRGVMEKCTFCVQRIRNGEQVAKREGRSLSDQDVVPACAAACPTKAIVFGDLNNPKSEATKLSHHRRAFRVLEELGTRPAIAYLAELKNPPKGGQR